MAKPSKQNVFYWLALLIVGFGIVGFVAFVVQQNYRLSANDPQIQMAEDTAAALQQGRAPSKLVPPGSVDITRSLAPFETIIDKQLRIVATNATANDAGLLLPPSGVFKDAAKKGEMRFTWQTAEGQRFATVVVPTANNFVITARSLKEVEKREDLLMIMAGVTLVCIALTVGVLYAVSRKLS